MQGNEETDVLTGRAARSESTQQQLGVRLDAVERRQLTQLDEMGLVRSNGKLFALLLSIGAFRREVTIAPLRAPARTFGPLRLRRFGLGPRS